MSTLRVSYRTFDDALARAHDATAPLGLAAVERHLFLLPLAYVLASYLVLLPGDGALHSLAEKENSYFQLLGALAFLGAAVIFVAAYTRSRGEAHHARNPRAKRLSYLLLALAFFVAAGEELSWGQHAVGFDAPEGLSDANRQNETNFHNLEALKGAPNQLFTAFWFGFTILVPLIALASGSTRRRLRRLLPTMPLAFGVLFALNYAASKVVEAYTSGHLRHSVVEIKESNFGVLFLLVAFYVVVMLVREGQEASLAPSPSAAKPPTDVPSERLRRIPPWPRTGAGAGPLV